MCKHHGSKAARVVQAQRALAGLQIHVVVLTGLARRVLKTQAARHAQMQQQKACVQIQQQVFTPPPYTQYLAACQGLRLAAQRPAQGFAHAQRQDVRPSNAIGKAQARHFYFG